MTVGPDNDNHPFPFPVTVVRVEFEFNDTIRELMDVAKVAVGEGMPQAKASEALIALRTLLALIDRAMPPELQAQDRRVLAARKLETQLVQMLRPSTS